MLVLLIGSRQSGQKSPDCDSIDWLCVYKATFAWLYNKIQYMEVMVGTLTPSLNSLPIWLYAGTEKQLKK